MKISPTLSDVKKIAATGQYHVLPVSLEILSDFTTPIETMKILKNVSSHCYMLESAQANETWGRYTFLGFDPKLEITCVDGEMKIGNFKVKTENPSHYLRQILADYKSPRFEDLPSFTGGLVGYFSYDYLGYSEPSVKCDVEDTENFKDVDLMLFDKVIAFDHLRQKIILIVNMPLDDVEVGYAKALIHGKQSRVKFDLDCPLFANCPETAPVARYHSLAVDPDTLPDCLQATAVTEDGEIMAVQHKAYPIYGVQFHPESIMTPDGKQMLQNFIKEM